MADFGAHHQFLERRVAAHGQAARVTHPDYLSWDATTNTPPLKSGQGELGDMYIVSVPGRTSLDGQHDWELNDLVVFYRGRWNLCKAKKRMRDRFEEHVRKNHQYGDDAFKLFEGRNPVYIRREIEKMWLIWQAACHSCSEHNHRDNRTAK